jgi:hypothetical protein
MNPDIPSPLGGAVIACALALFSGLPSHAESPKSEATLTVTSSAFPAEGAIPTKYTCEGANVSPPLSWTGLPANTKSVAVICDDPDAPSGTWVHWVLYNLPAPTTSLAEKMDTAPTLPNGARQGINNFGKIGYAGPCPPEGKAHHYFFKVYALDSVVILKPGATKNDLLSAMHHHILAEGLLMGKYQRKK